GRTSCVCRLPWVPDGAQCRQSRWAEAIWRARPLRGTRDIVSPGWSPEHGVSVRYWAYSSLHELPMDTPRTNEAGPSRHEWVSGDRTICREADWRKGQFMDD